MLEDLQITQHLQQNAWYVVLPNLHHRLLVELGFQVSCQDHNSDHSHDNDDNLYDHCEYGDNNDDTKYHLHKVGWIRYPHLLL